MGQLRRALCRAGRDDARIGRGPCCSAPARRRWPIGKPTARLPIGVGAIPSPPELRRDGGIRALPADQLLQVGGGILVVVGHGCKGGPGWRGQNGQCVSHANLTKECDTPPSTRCSYEGARQVCPSKASSANSNVYACGMFVIPYGAPEGYEWFVTLVVLVCLYFAVRNFMRGRR
jgi:hypothetical protein